MSREVALKIHPEVASLLIAAYQPCPGFSGSCPSMEWSPERGRVPRGFCGATAGPQRVELVLVCAEPGDPHQEECHAPSGSPLEQLESAFAYAYRCFRDSTDLFHRNVRAILESCYPQRSFEDQLTRVWITESVKCSAVLECGYVAVTVERACRSRFLDRELELFPGALVVALGGKAARRLKGRPRVLEVAAAAPPFGVRKVARETWLQIPIRLAETRSS